MLEAVAGLPHDDFKVYTGDIFRHVLSQHWVLPTSTLIRASAIRSGAGFPEVDAWWGDSEFFARLSHRAGAVFVGLETVLESQSRGCRAVDAKRPDRAARGTRGAHRQGLARRRRIHATAR